MGDSGSQGTPFMVALAVLLSGIVFMIVVVVTVLVLASQIELAGTA